MVGSRKKKEKPDINSFMHLVASYSVRKIPAAIIISGQLQSLCKHAPLLVIYLIYFIYNIPIHTHTVTYLYTAELLTSSINPSDNPPNPVKITRVIKCRGKTFPLIPIVHIIIFIPKGDGAAAAAAVRETDTRVKVKSLHSH